MHQAFCVAVLGLVTQLVPVACFTSHTSSLYQQPAAAGSRAVTTGPALAAFRNDERSVDAKFQQRKEWLEQTTSRLLAAPNGSLDKGKWHEVISILSAWSSFAKKDPNAPIRMEALLKRLVEEPTAQVSVQVYNKILDAWACAALFKTRPAARASQRAREILVSLQERFEVDHLIQPDHESFDVVYHVVCRTEGPVVARRVLALREHLFKTGKNPCAAPRVDEYALLLSSYANHGGPSAGMHAAGLLSHMRVVGIQPTLLCYNLVIKAWIKAGKGRAAAEQADRILEEMDVQPDSVTYSSIISAWATSGMKAHAVARVEELLKQVPQPNTIVMNAVMTTWVKSRSPNSVARTEEILRLMENSTDDRMRPDLISYNTHIHALSMHSARHPHYAKQALQLLTTLEASYEAGKIAFRPNLFSYNLVIDSFCLIQEPKTAAMVLKRLLRSQIEPDTFSFNKILSALSKSSIPRAYEISEGLLRYMDKAHKTGVHPQARPDVVSYGSLLLAYSRHGNAETVWKAEALLQEMKERYLAGDDHLKPNRVCYNSLIDCWAKSGRGTFGARKAEELLQEMQAQWENGDASMAPDIITYNAVLNAWARSNTRCCAVQAEKYLNRMWELYYAGEEKVKPNDHSYNTVINAISKSRNEGKAQKALRVLRKMDLLYRAGNKETRPNQVTYTAVINSCAFPASNDPKLRKKALDTAIFTLTELQNSPYGHPNEVTYGMFIKAISNLLDQDDDELRREIIERAFRQCCNDGQVGEMVLSYLRKAAPSDLYEELLSDIIQSSGTTITVEDLPVEWRMNLKEKHRRKKLGIQREGTSG
jgi:pentatricopeptide repeat protein